MRLEDWGWLRTAASHGLGGQGRELQAVVRARCWDGTWRRAQVLVRDLAWDRDVGGLEHPEPAL